MSSTGTGGGLLFSSLMTPSTREIIGRQSCTATPHLRQHLLQRLHDLGAARIVGDALDVDMDEAFARLAVAAVRLLRRGLELAALVALDRNDRMRDQADVEARARSSSPITESTRNGMSSLTISMTEIVLRRSPSDASGDSKRIFGAPGLRMAKNDQALARKRRELGRVVAHQILRAPCARTSVRRNRPARRFCCRARAFLPHRCVRGRCGLRAWNDRRRRVGSCELIRRHWWDRPKRTGRANCSGFAWQRKGCRLPST